jgi:hypothetical protein
MGNINNYTLLHITLNANEVQPVTYDQAYVLDIQNCGSSDVKISHDKDFTEHENVAEYISVESGCGYNGFRLTDEYLTLYFRSDSDGAVNVVARSVY